MAGEIFISYQRADEQWARLLHAQLRAEGISAWYDAQIGMGQDWRSATAKVLESSRIFVLLFSSNTAQSAEVAKELAAATFEKKLIIPVRLEDVAPKGAFLYELASRNWLNAFENTEASLAELAKSIAQLVRSGNLDDSALLFNRAGGNWTKPSSRARLFGPSTGIAAAGILIALAAGLFWMERRPAPPPSSPRLSPARIAINAFEVPGNDDALRQFAVGLKAEIVGQLSKNQIPVVAGSGGSRIGYAYSGTIERSGENILVHAHLDDARQGIAVWSAEYQGAAVEPRPLQQAIAAQAATVTQTAAFDDKLANGDADAMTLLIKSSQFAYSNVQSDREAEWENARQLAAKFPAIPNFQANFAIVGAVLAINSRPERAAQLRTAAKAAALRAVALDPNHGELAYLAQYFLVPSIGGWTEREGYLLQGLAKQNNGGGLTNNESNFLREVGRLKEAIEYGRQARAVIPHTPNRDASLILALAATGNRSEAAALAEISGKSWPAHPAVWYARFELALYNSQWNTALSLLTPGGYVPIAEPVADAWRSALKAALSGGAAAKRGAIQKIVSELNSVHDLIVNPPYEVMTPGGAIVMLAVLGDLDTAFAQAAIYLKPDTYADSSFLFTPNLTQFRRDPRFMQLATHIGLTDYWRKSGKWPDFCAEPGLPYTCR